MRGLGYDYRTAWVWIKCSNSRGSVDRGKTAECTPAREQEKGEEAGKEEGEEGKKERREKKERPTFNF